MCMMSENEKLNDYDFVLFHLYIKSEAYRQYYLTMRCLQPGRLMILDCSAYEYYVSKQELPAAEFARVISELKPDYYICPDTLMDMDKTLDDTMEFLSEYKQNVGSEPMAVAQGNTPQELVHCLMQYYKLGLKAVAIPFHNSFFVDYGDVDERSYLAFHPAVRSWNDDMAYAAGRMHFVTEIAYLLKEFDHVHLLGSHCVIEHGYYPTDIVNTMDTGYPVKCAIAGYELFSEPHKPDIIIDDFLDDNLSEPTKELIRSNIYKFRSTGYKSNVNPK